MALRLRYSETSIVLPAGQIFVGRSPECDLVISDPQASRRHAVITMGKTGAFVSDLGSRAGVRVNGEVIDGARRLAAGDAIQIASASISVEDATFDDDEPADPRLRSTLTPPAMGGDPPAPRTGHTPPLGLPRIQRARVQETFDDDDDFDDDDEEDAHLARTQDAPLLRQETLLSRQPAPPSSQDRDAPLSRTQDGPRVVVVDSSGARLPPSPDASRPPSTLSGRAAPTSVRVPRFAPLPSFPREGTLRALAAVGEKAIALGRAEEAERILQRALHETLEGVRRGEVDAPTAELAASLAARLAAATGAGRWFDHAVAVYAVRSELAPAQVVDLLYAAVGKARGADKALFREYLAVAKATAGDSPARRFVIQRLEGLQQILDLK